MEVYKLRIALCDALTSPYMKEQLGTEWHDEIIKVTEPLRMAIINVDDDELINHWREWEDVLQGKRKPTFRPIEHDPMRAFIEVTF